MIKKTKRKVFFTKNACLNKKSDRGCIKKRGKWKIEKIQKIWIGLRCGSFFLFFLKILFVHVLVMNHDRLNLLCTTRHFMLFMSCMHTSFAYQDIKWNTFSQICFLGINMRDRLEARISVVEDIQEEFRHDIWKMKEQLARLTSLFEDYIKTQAVPPQGPSPMPTQCASRPNPRPFIPTTSHLSRETNRPNLRLPMPIAPPAFIATSRPIYQPRRSRDQPSRQKIGKDKPQWDPIPITYTELFPKLVEIGHIEPIHLASFRPPFSRWYNAHSPACFRGNISTCRSVKWLKGQT